MSFRRSTVFFAVMAVFAIAQSQNLFAAGLDVGGALGRVKGAVDAVTQPAGGAAVPSGAVELFRKVDQNLAKVDSMLSGENANYDKDYRMKEAAARLLEAQEGLKTAEQRYGSKMGRDNPELVSRRYRIAALEPKVKAFQGDTVSAMQKDKDAQDTAQKSEAAQDSARQERMPRTWCNGRRRRRNPELRPPGQEARAETGLYFPSRP